MASSIKIKRSETAGNPAVLGAGELAYSALTDNGSNGGDRLYLGSGTETAGNAVNHLVIGGKYFTDMLDHARGTLTANSAIITDGSGKVDQINVSNVTITGNTVSTTDTNGNLILSPNGTGKVSIKGVYTLPTNAGTINYVLTTDGSGTASWQAAAGGSYAAGVNSFLTNPTSNNLATAVTDETGSGYLVFNISPTFNTSILGSGSSFDLLNTTVTTLNIGGAATALTLGATTGTTTVRNNLTVTGGINVGSHIIPATDVAYDLGSATYKFRDLYLSGSSIKLGGATITASGTSITTGAIDNTPIGSTTASTATFTTVATSGNVTVGGNLTVNGTTTTINSTTINVDDKNLELGSIASPTDSTADGGGITLKGLTDKTLNWVNATASWTSSENFDLATGKSYYINGSNVLSATTLGSAVINSSLTSVGIIATGTWNATVITPAYGGTGLNSITSRGIIYGNASGTVGVTAASSVDGSFLRADASGNPYFSNVIDGGTY
jgi:hypothetical protein